MLKNNAHFQMPVDNVVTMLKNGQTMSLDGCSMSVKTNSVDFRKDNRI